MKKATSSHLIEEDTLTAAAFKAHCLRIMDEVARRRRPMTVTKRGKPIVRLVPIEAKLNAFVGVTAGLVLGMEPLDTPTGEGWDADGA